ncbi:MAG: hypothetical protein JOY99_06615 [Sphingomonadaceae bacterium]|nr:hypothetical protein [Sphingomonadaceae bacterium]
MAATLLLSVLLMGFSIGLLHALDADHLMTISSLAARPDRGVATMRYAGLWALGHGGLLIAIACAGLLLGWSLPVRLPASAERLVGVVLIFAGASGIVSTLRRDGASGGVSAGIRSRMPFLIGMIHGTASSAAMMALIPLALLGPVLGIAFVTIFSFGVLSAMMAFGFALERGQQWLTARRPQLLRAVHMSVGIGAIGMGVFWLQTA